MRVELDINGLTNNAVFPDEDIRQLHEPLLNKLADVQKKLNRRLVVFLCAPPGTGKSTLATFWQWLSQRDARFTAVQALPMDGFHHYNQYLDEHNLRKYKGAPDTFDVQKLTLAIKRLRQKETSWPKYDRRLHDPVEDVIKVTAPIVIVEGNWLLLDHPQWKPLMQYCDYSISIQSPPELLKQRLIDRKVRGGLSQQQAETFFETSDGVNILLVMEHSRKADLQLNMDSDGRYKTVHPE